MALLLLVRLEPLFGALPEAGVLLLLTGVAVVFVLLLPAVLALLEVVGVAVVVVVVVVGTLCCLVWVLFGVLETDCLVGVVPPVFFGVFPVPAVDRFVSVLLLLLLLVLFPLAVLVIGVTPRPPACPDEPPSGCGSGSFLRDSSPDLSY